jgi:hypothetical protein
MVEVLSHFLGFFIGFTLTLGIIGSILYYIKPDSRKSTYFIWDLFIFGIITTLVILLTLIIISQ